MLSIDWPSIDWAWVVPILVGYAIAFAFAVALAKAADDGRLPHPPEKPTDLMARRDADAAFERDFLLIADGKPPVDDWDFPMVQREIV